MKTGIELIAEERERQLEKEEWSLAHDKNHYPGTLALAAACYAVNKNHPPVGLNREYFLGEKGDAGVIFDAFPFSPEYDKREKHSRLKSLVIAGALIAAEIDRELAENPQEEFVKKIKLQDINDYLALHLQSGYWSNLLDSKREYCFIEAKQDVCSYLEIDEIDPSRIFQLCAVAEQAIHVANDRLDVEISPRAKVFLEREKTCLPESQKPAPKPGKHLFNQRNKTT